MTLRKDVENVVNLREFHRSVEQLLTPEDRDYLFYSLKEYHTYRSVAKLMLALNSCLDTPKKLDLLPYIRELIPKHDRRKFDGLAPYDRMARETSPPPAVKARDEESTTTPPSRDSTIPTLVQGGTKVITMQRPRGTSLGFSIRGGREHELGVYVSHVDSLSLAEKYGLQPGDQILNVNGVSFEQITHSSAALVLTSHDEFRMVVKSVGKIPGRPTGRNSFIWVDAKGNPIGDVDTAPDTTEQVTENRAAGHRLLASPDRQKVVLHANRKKAMGFSIRGGSEYNLGIYISVVDKDSLAEESGLRVGDQVLDVNGHSFVNIIHAEAVTILRSYPTLIMTIKSLGRVPRLATEMQAQHEEAPKQTPQFADQGLPSRTSTFFKALTSPLSPRRKSPSRRDQAHYTSDAALYKGQSALGFTKRESRHRGERAAHYASEVALHRTPETAVPFQSPRTRGSDKRRARSFHESAAQGVPRESHASIRSQTRPQASSTGANTLPRARGTKSPIGLSPLVTSNVRAPASPTQMSPPSSSPNRVVVGVKSTRMPFRDTGSLKHQSARSPEHDRSSKPKNQSPEFHPVHSPPTSPTGTGSPPRVPSPSGAMSGTHQGVKAEAEEPSFFEHGVGTQVMLSSANSQAMGILLSQARKLLDTAAVDELREKLKQYEQARQIESLVQFLDHVLDSPEKLQLLTDVRSVLQPSDLPKFDELVSRREVDALHDRALQGRHWGQYDLEGVEKADREHRDEVADRYTMVLTEIQNGGGQRALRHSREEDTHPPHHQAHDLGAFGTSTAQEMLDKASSDEPSMVGLQTKESFLAWNDEYGDHRRDIDKDGFSSSNAVVVEIIKSAPNLGLSVEGGVNTPKPEVCIKGVYEGGSAHNDGFLKAGFEIVEVDGVKVRGKTHEQAVRTIKQAFNSEKPTIEFVVIPN